MFVKAFLTVKLTRQKSLLLRHVAKFQRFLWSLAPTTPALFVCPDQLMKQWRRFCFGPPKKSWPVLIDADRMTPSAPGETSTICAPCSHVVELTHR